MCEVEAPPEKLARLVGASGSFQPPGLLGQRQVSEDTLPPGSQ